MSSPFNHADFYLRFNGRTTKRIVDMGSSVEKRHPRPNPLERGPCPNNYHEHLMKARIFVCMVCMLRVPEELQRKLAELHAKKMAPIWFDEQVRAAIERTKLAVRHETKVGDSDEQSEDMDSEDMESE